MSKAVGLRARWLSMLFDSSPVTQDWRTTPTRTVAAASTQFAYRRLGSGRGVPVVLLNHWGANLDNFDPAVVNALSADRPVFLLDYRGVGWSGGSAPLSVAAMAYDVVAVIAELRLEEVDLIGFSLGGFVAQQIALDAPHIVRRIVLAGTGPAGGEAIDQVGAVSLPLILKNAVRFRDPKHSLFFPHSNVGQEAARAFLDRLKARVLDRDKPVGPLTFLRQLKAIKAWGRQSPQPLETLQLPVLVVNGDNDIMVPTSNSATLVDRIPGSRLVIYPNAGHGSIFQYHSAFIAEVKKFFA